MFYYAIIQISVYNKTKLLKNKTSVTTQNNMQELLKTYVTFLNKNIDISK